MIIKHKKRLLQEAEVGLWSVSRLDCNKVGSSPQPSPCCEREAGGEISWASSSLDEAESGILPR